MLIQNVLYFEREIILFCKVWSIKPWALFKKMLILTSSDIGSAKVNKFQARNRIYLNCETTPKIMILPWMDLVNFNIRTLVPICGKIGYFLAIKQIIVNLLIMKPMLPTVVELLCFASPAMESGTTLLARNKIHLTGETTKKSLAK